jgi:hypothetical protein
VGRRLHFCDNSRHPPEPAVSLAPPLPRGVCSHTDVSEKENLSLFTSTR